MKKRKKKTENQEKIEKIVQDKMKNENKNKSVIKKKLEKPKLSIFRKTEKNKPTEIVTSEKTFLEVQQENPLVKPNVDNDIPKWMTNCDAMLSLPNSIGNTINCKENRERNLESDEEKRTSSSQSKKSLSSSSTPKKNLKKDLFKRKIHSPMDFTRKGRGTFTKLEEIKNKSKVKMMVEIFENELKRSALSLEPKPKMKRSAFSLEPQLKFKYLPKDNPFISSDATKKPCDQSDETLLTHPRQTEHLHRKDCYNWSDRGEMENLDQ